MRRGFVYSLAVLLSSVLFGCTSLEDVQCPPAADKSSKSIYLVSHGWHAGIVLRRADIPPGIRAGHVDFPEAEYLEVGWGDKDFYMTPDPHLGITLKAGLLPTESVLHVVGFRGRVTDYFPYSEVIRIDLSDAGFERLCRYLEHSYARSADGLSQPLGPSLYGDGRFYLSRETYHAFNTCNVWIARALRDAGCPITPAGTLTVETLMDGAAGFGQVIQARPDTSGAEHSFR